VSEQWQARKNCSVCSVKGRKIPFSSYFVRDFDIGDSIGCLRYYAGWADKILGQVCIPVGHCLQKHSLSD
jgi:hypothetical protein